MSNVGKAAQGVRRQGFFQTLELDTRLLGMVGAFAFIAIAFQIWTGIRASGPGFDPVGWLTGGRYLIPQNTYNIAVQTISVAIMATGMVFVIVTRHIDLSVGSVLAVCSAVMAIMQTQILPHQLGLGLGHPLIMPLAVLSGIVTGMLVGALQGWLIGYQGIPSFIVTLGGLLIWSRVAYFVVGGQTIGPLDSKFLMLGGVNGTIGAMLSWALGAAAAVVAVMAILRGRKAKLRHGFAVKPVWAELTLAGMAVAGIMGFIAILNANMIPPGRLTRMFAERGEEVPEGYSQAFGLPISVILLLVVAIGMTVVARRTRFGRYIFATGGNPDAAALSGINTKFLTVKVFALMGALCGLSAAVASARLSNHSLDLGQLDELRVIAAAVIGGTALAGGIGTIYGAILGALIMQALQSGMAMVGLDAPMQNIVVGAVLVNAVLIDVTSRAPHRWPTTIAIIMAQVAVVFFFAATWWLAAIMAALALAVQILGNPRRKGARS